MKYFILSFIVLCSGCASAGMDSFCGHVTGSDLTVPYVGGKTNADAYVCHMGCVGAKCPQPDYATLAALTSDYLKNTGGKIVTTGPGTVTFTPTTESK